MGGLGSGGHGENQHTTRKRWIEMYGPDVPYVYKRKARTGEQLNQAVDAGESPESMHDGETVTLMPGQKFPRKKPTFAGKRKTRSDKGKSRTEVKRKVEVRLDNAQEDIPLTWDNVQEDLLNTLSDIKRFELWEEDQAYKKSERAIKHAKRRRAAVNKRYYETNRDEIASKGRDPNAKRKAERLSLLPPNLTCPSCNMVKRAAKQWVMVEFADGKRMICRVCFDKVRFKSFGGNAPATRIGFKMCKFDNALELLKGL